MLGTAVYNAFRTVPSNIVLGLAHSRPRENLKVLDLLDQEEVERVFAEFRPDCKFFVYAPCVLALRSIIQVVIHSAAERRPDVAEKVL